ncbi:hypothetical protein [Agromyces laixinhei]|uniref:hypothetical protein n=1 Tax=Agromyces laixinhei TaxID=2585717 RepID=UPI0012EEC637|nr:hypothetical protein [Agromyces laixinhei]
MDWLDEVVRESAPPALGSSPGVRDRVVAVAVDAVSRRERPPSWRSRLRNAGVGAGLGFGVLALGVGAAAAAPAVIDWLGWTPDVVAQRTFDLDDGTELGLCEVFIRVTPVYGTTPDEEVDRRAESARRFLTTHDWDPVIASITAAEIRAEFERDQAQRESVTTDTVTPPPATLSGAATSLISDRIGAEFERAGHLQDGVSLEGAAGPCTAENDGAAE